MAGKEDLSFGFDTKFFEAGIKKVTKQLLIFAGSVKGLGKLFGEIPEIGKTFGIAKDIVFKNFLFPLRKAIFPMLQRFLDFIRDNRKTFVVWGQSLANVFSSVAGGLMEIMKLGKQLGDLFINFVNRTFGLQLKSFQDLINLTTFKIAVAIEFLKSAFPSIIEKLQPFIDLISIGLGDAIVAVTSLVSSFIKATDGIGAPFQSILETILSIVDAFTDVDSAGNKTNRILDTIGETLGIIIKFAAEMADSFLLGIKPAIIAMEKPFNKIAAVFKRIFGDTEIVEKWKTLFTFIGEVIGAKLVGAFNIIASVVELIGIGIEKLLDIFNSGPFQKFLNFAGDIAGKVGGFFTGALEGVKDFFAGEKVDDAIITKKGEVIKTNPEDNILAFKKFPVAPGGGGLTIGNINIDFAGMTIQVAEATTEAAVNFGGNIVDVIRQKLNDELVRVGAV